MRVYFGFIIDKTTVFLCAVFAGHTELSKTSKENTFGSLEVILPVTTPITIDCHYEDGNIRLRSPPRACWGAQGNAQKTNFDLEIENIFLNP